jgi:hypothetical protein
MEAILRGKINKINKYDLDVKTSLSPLKINITDRMTAEILYFLQFTFEWHMRKYKRPNKDISTSQDMKNFYKVMMYNILSDISLHKLDYNNLLKLVSQWDYNFLNETTL